MLRFHTPLIEPDRRFSRIRLSEKGSRVRPRKAAGPRGKTDQTKLIMQGRFWKPLRRWPRQFVLGAQPPTQPRPSMSFHRPVGFTDRTETEVVGPSNHHPVELFHYCCLIQQGLVPSGFAADRLTDAAHPLL